MAVTLRLQRHGGTHRPFYHIVAADKRRARDGRFIEKIGYYDPNLNPSIINVDVERAQYWYSKGCQVSETVQHIFKHKKITLSRTTTK